MLREFGSKRRVRLSRLVAKQKDGGGENPGSENSAEPVKFDRCDGCFCFTILIYYHHHYYFFLLLIGIFEGGEARRGRGMGEHKCKWSEWGKQSRSVEARTVEANVTDHCGD